MAKQYDRKIVLENGTEFYGTGFGAKREVIHEIVFNTAMAGYQEIISDPSSTGQIVVMTYPLIGNYGITDDDFESRTPSLGGFIVREYNHNPSNFRWTKTLGELLEEHNIPAISGVDTRRITRMIRSEGSQKVMITAPETPLEEALAKINAYELPRDMVAKVSCNKRWYSRTANHRYNVVAVDCGMKLNIMRMLNVYGCNVTVVPYNVKPDEILALKPDGIFLSNGPGNPEDVPEVVALVKALRGKLPMFGICLGYQCIALAYGAKTFKMKFGHRGGNHPIKEIASGKVEITGQNHSYAVDISSLDGTALALTHINLLDNTAEGVSCLIDNIIAVQYHPESAPGPQDSAHLFGRFIDMIEKEARNNA